MEEQDEVLSEALDVLAMESPMAAETVVRVEYRSQRVIDVAKEMGVAKGTASKRRTKGLARLRILIEAELPQSSQRRGEQHRAWLARCS